MEYYEKERARRQSLSSTGMDEITSITVKLDIKQFQRTLDQLKRYAVSSDDQCFEFFVSDDKKVKIKFDDNI